jgi:hypothetical protein
MICSPDRSSWKIQNDGMSNRCHKALAGFKDLVPALFVRRSDAAVRHVIPRSEKRRSASCPKDRSRSRAVKLRVSMFVLTTASLGLAFSYLAGDETVLLTNLTPDGELRFNLPGDTPRIMLDIGLGERELTATLQTVCVRVEEHQLDLIWAGAHEYPGREWLTEMNRLVAEVR